MASHRLAVAALLASTVIPAAAAHADQILYYAGDPQVGYGGYAGSNTAGDNFLNFENFTVPTGQTWSVTSVFANNGVVDIGTDPTPPATWSIRTGLSATSLGAIVADDTTDAGTTTDVPSGFVLNGGNVTGVRQTVTLSSAVVLAGGHTYWVAVDPVGNAVYHLFGGGTSSNSNGVGGPFDQSGYLDYGATIQAVSFDWSEGVAGTFTQAAVPESASWAILAVGLVGLGASRRKTLHVVTDGA